MNNMGMIEKVARAMIAQSKSRMAGTWLTAVVMDGEEDFVALAKAAIEAMREPTVPMSAPNITLEYSPLGDKTPSIFHAHIEGHGFEHHGTGATPALALLRAAAHWDAYYGASGEGRSL